MRILLVEDDELLGDGVCAGLETQGYRVEWVRDGAAAEAALATDEFAALVLDLGLPRRSGIQVLTTLRAAGSELPVLILTARDTIQDRVLGLDSGADDYLVKPFDLLELAARLRALTRRGKGRAAPLLVHGPVTLDPAARSVTLNGTPVDLSPREFALIHHLLSHAGQVLSRTQLEQALYGWSDEVDSNALEVHIHHLRRKLGPELIRTVRGVGYTADRRKDGS